MTSLVAATLNIRNLADRWWERAPLLFGDMAALQPDVIGLQEVVYPLQQDRLIGASGPGSYAALRGWAGRPEYGNSILVKEPFGGTSPDRLELGHNRSAHAAANGREPDVTWPSGIQAPGMDVDGDPGCLDYIWVRGAIEVMSCRVAFDRPAVGDATLYPSDHFGLVAELRVGE